MDFLKKLSIKQLFKKHEVELKDLKFGEAALADGTIVEFPEDAITVGQPVMVATDQGILPIPDGEYTLADGTVFVVVGGQGIVESITPAEATAPEGEVPAEEVAPVASEEMEDESAPMTPKRIIESIVKESVFTTSEEFSAFTASQNAVIEAQNAKIDEQLAVINALFSLVEKIAADKPSDKPAEKKAHAFSKEKKSNPMLAKLIEIRNKY